jgi:hypothetical protein
MGKLKAGNLGVENRDFRSARSCLSEIVFFDIAAPSSSKNPIVIEKPEQTKTRARRRSEYPAAGEPAGGTLFRTTLFRGTLFRSTMHRATKYQRVKGGSIIHR